MYVTVKPIEQIIITILHKTNLDFLTKKEAVTENPELLWCNGIIFNAYEYDNKKIQAKELEGIQHFSTVLYADCKEFQEQAKWNGFSVEVLNYSGNPVYEALTKFLGEQK